MLKESFELLQKIEAGIKHKSMVNLSLSEGILLVEVSIVCTKNRQTCVFRRVFTRSEMITYNDDQLVDYFIKEANKGFEVAYGKDV